MSNHYYTRARREARHLKTASERELARRMAASRFKLMPGESPTTEEVDAELTAWKIGGAL